MLEFPKQFLWGTATASYQIEGAVNEDGRGDSIWDVFCRQPGAIADNSSGDVACDHYHRWQEDIAQMQQHGIQAYRFSIAWPRIFPDAGGKANAKGIAFYDRLVDGLLAAGIQPCATLYHWDLPQWLHEQGGWTNRAVLERFSEYADQMTRALGDRVPVWFTLNEPNVSAFNGYMTGEFAPGMSNPVAFLRASLHKVIAHGIGVQAVRRNSPGSQVGLVAHEALFHPLSASEEDHRAAAFANASFNRMYTDPAMRGVMPDEVLPLFAQSGIVIDADELSQANQPVDFLGVNHYTRSWVQADADAPFGITVRDDHQVAGASYTAMGWEVYPQGIGEVLSGLHKRYGCPLVITENGGAFDDQVSTGKGGERLVDDKDRIALLDGYLRAIHQAIDEGVDVRGYFAWSWLDNFEWAHGLSKRFGLVHVDYDSLARTAKSSAAWYRQVIAANGLVN